MSKVDNLYKFMLQYQIEHRGEEIPPTLQQMADEVTQSKGMAHYYLQQLCKRGLVEKRACGSRKYVAVRKAGPDTLKGDTK